jgi:hypothetical protein
MHTLQERSGQNISGPIVVRLHNGIVNDDKIEGMVGNMEYAGPNFLRLMCKGDQNVRLIIKSSFCTKV